VAGTSKPRPPQKIRVAQPAPGNIPWGGLVAWVNRWPLTARLYEPLWRHRSLGILTAGHYSTARELATMCAWGGPLAGARVLDLGCSAGLYARTLAAAGAEVSALDQSPAFLREAARLALAAGVAFELVQGDAHALPYPDGAFDLVVVGASLNEFADPPRAFREVARVLAPEGRLWLMYARRARGVGGMLQGLMRLATLRFPDPMEVDSYADDAGLTKVRSEVRGPVALALYRRGAANVVRSAGERAARPVGTG
jgi:ubiquinone/menaquinone biosynthesis C-methylase UbiE